MKILSIILLSIIVFSATAQNKYVQKMFGYVERGATTTTHLIYIEMPGDLLPIWDSAIIDGSKYVVHATAVEEIPVKVGKRKSDNRMIVLKPAIDTKLYKLDFDLVEEFKQTSKSITAPAAQVILRGSFKNRRITSKVSNLTELVPLEMQ